MTHKLYTILLSRDIKTKKVPQSHPHPHLHPHQNKKKVFGYKSEILIKYKRIKWTPSSKASQITPRRKKSFRVLKCDPIKI